LNNAEDLAGRWQIEGGNASQGKQMRKQHYSNVKRVSCGTQEQNTAQPWITLFFPKGKPPENITCTARMISTVAGKLAATR
jgi:hypothetical protein